MSEERWAVRKGDVWCCSSTITAGGSSVVGWSADRGERKVFSSREEAHKVRVIGGRKARLVRLVRGEVPMNLRELQVNLVLARERVAALESCLRDVNVRVAEQAEKAKHEADEHKATIQAIRKGLGCEDDEERTEDAAATLRTEVEYLWRENGRLLMELGAHRKPATTRFT